MAVRRSPRKLQRQNALPPVPVFQPEPEPEDEVMAAVEEPAPEPEPENAGQEFGALIPGAGVKKRNFCWTWFNYPSSYEANLSGLYGDPSVRYTLMGLEVCPQTGKPHGQGFTVFKNPRSFNGARQFLQQHMPGCHVKVCRGSISQNVDYCKKQETASAAEKIIVEHGEQPIDHSAPSGAVAIDWGATRLAAEEGRLDDIDERIRFSMDQTIDRHRQRALLRRILNDSEVQMEWFCGPSRTGKSRLAREMFPGAYLKNCNKWWDGYQPGTDHDKCVLIDDFDKRHEVLIHFLKIWADRYPFNAEIKGGTLMIRPEKIIVTSNFHPEEIWSEQGDLEPILKRFKITRFGLGLNRRMPREDARAVPGLPRSPARRSKRKFGALD